MAVRVQVILDETDAAEFRRQARRQSCSLSGWLREAGRKELARCREVPGLQSPEALGAFFAGCDALEAGIEPDWESHKEAILGGMSRRKGG